MQHIFIREFGEFGEFRELCREKIPNQLQEYGKYPICII